MSDKVKRAATGKDPAGQAPDKKRRVAKAKKERGDANVISVATHPRAQGRIRQAKGWGGLSAFGVTAYLSLAHGVSADVAGMRAIAAGVGGYVVGWGCSVMIWRQLMVAELRARVHRARRQAEADARGPESELESAAAS